MRYPEYIEKDNGQIMKLSLITREHVFYVDFSLDIIDQYNDTVIMYDRDMTMLSCNYFAFAEFMDRSYRIMENMITPVYMSKEMMEQIVEV